MVCNDNLLLSLRDQLKMIELQILSFFSCSPCSLNPLSLRSSQTRTISLRFLDYALSIPTSTHDSKDKHS